MQTILYIPIEPISERYTEQWFRKFPEAFREAGYNVRVICGIPLLHDEIKVGTFLDVNSTTYYKWSQLQAISAAFHKGEIENGTIFFFGDIEFWGLEAIRLLADMNGIKVRITGFLHAASYTREDAFAIAAPYQQYTEVGWIASLDKVFVGSEYHKRAVITRRLQPLGAEHLAKRIVVTKNPVFTDEYHDFGNVPKQKKVLLTNRFDHEKRPDETLALFQKLKAAYPDWRFIVTTSRPKIRGNESDYKYLMRLVDFGIVEVKEGLTKEEYHRELAEAYMVVSHSPEENYGYCIAESIHYGCIPLLLQGASHDEFVGRDYLFSTIGTDFIAACRWMNRYEENNPIPLVLDTSGMQNIVRELKTLKV